VVINRRPVRFVRRAPFFGGIYPYGYDYPQYSAPVIYQEQYGAPIYVQTETPVNVNVVTQQLCGGPRIIEVGKPKKRRDPLPRVVYGIPLNCAAGAENGGPGVSSAD
jgi:hypothetical protein